MGLWAPGPRKTYELVYHDNVLEARLCKRDSIPNGVLMSQRTGCDYLQHRPPKDNTCAWCELMPREQHFFTTAKLVLIHISEFRPSYSNYYQAHKEKKKQYSYSQDDRPPKIEDKEYSKT